MLEFAIGKYWFRGVPVPARSLRVPQYPPYRYQPNLSEYHSTPPTGTSQIAQSTRVPPLPVPHQNDGSIRSTPTARFQQHCRKVTVPQYPPTGTAVPLYSQYHSTSCSQYQNNQNFRGGFAPAPHSQYNYITKISRGFTPAPHS